MQEIEFVEQIRFYTSNKIAWALSSMQLFSCGKWDRFQIKLENVRFNSGKQDHLKPLYDDRRSSLND